jgi:hypothetical protein
MRTKWGIASIVFLATAVSMGLLCGRLVRDSYHCLVPYLLLNFFAMVCGIIAASRGSKWWLIVSLFSGLFVAQAITVLLVE